MGARERYACFGLAAVVAVVLVAGLVEIGSRLFGSCRSLPGAGRELAALQAEPILSFRAPGATFDGTTSNVAEDCNAMGQKTSEPASVSQRFSLAGDPPTAIEAYVAAASAAGWQLRLMACSRSRRAIRVLFTKDGSGTTPQLHVAGFDPYPPGARSVDVSITGSQLSLQPGPDETADDLHCVRPVKAGDPGLRAFAVLPTRTPVELCGLLSVADLQNHRISVSRMVPEVQDGVPVCTYGTYDSLGEVTVLSLRDASTVAPAVYADRRLPTPPPGGDRLFLIAGDVTRERSGVWIDSGRGPVLLETGKQTDDVVMALAKLVQSRAK